MDTIGKHAVVLGASLAGLLAARVLSEAYEQVTLIERDRLHGEPNSGPDTAPDPGPRTSPNGADRRGVPQGRHAHVLLPSGLAATAELFPGLVEELTDEGAPAGWMPAEGHVEFGRQVLTRTRAERALYPSRPLLEWLVRQRLLARPGVSVREHTDAAGLVIDSAGTRITGVRLVPRKPGSAEEVLPADLVVDATGRGSRTPTWLGELGYPAPPEQRLYNGLGYASRWLRLPPAGLGGDLVVLVGGHPGRPRGMAMMAHEGGRWLLTLAGLGDHRPPLTPDGFLAFAATVAPPRVYAAIRDAEPLSEIVGFRTPYQLRRRYERLKRFPDGLLVVGDALCSFSPVYGQGMSVAALEALRLRDCLRRGSDRLGRRFFRAAARVVEPAWQLAIGADLALPEVEGPRPVPVRVVNAWVARVLAAAARDPVVAATFMRVTALTEPPRALFRPGVVARVLWHPVRHAMAG